MAYPILRLTLWPLIRAFFVKQISGIENIPRKVPFLIVANHQSHFDPHLLMMSFAMKHDRKITFVALEEFFHHWTVLFVGPFGVIRQNGAVKKALEKLKAGHIIGIFPEGRRTYDGKMQKIEHSGAGVIAVLGKIPVVPVAIKGAFKVWPRQRNFPRFRKNIEVIIGKPISLERYYKKKLTRAQYLKLTKDFMKEVARLLK